MEKSELLHTLEKTIDLTDLNLSLYSHCSLKMVFYKFMRKWKFTFFYILIISISYSISLPSLSNSSGIQREINFQSSNTQRIWTKVNAQFLYYGLTRLCHVPVTKYAELVFEVLPMTSTIVFHIMCPKNQKYQTESKNSRSITTI